MELKIQKWNKKSKNGTIIDILIQNIEENLKRGQKKLTNTP
jgi:hypothetical protein